MSIGLTLYVAERSQLNNLSILPSIMITLDETYLTEYFIEGEGKNFIVPLPKDVKLHVFTCDEEETRLVDKNLYGENLQYCLNSNFYTIPKEIIKNDTIMVKSAVKFIRKLPDHIVILYYT